jgi:hypothetical protein
VQSEEVNGSMQGFRVGTLLFLAVVFHIRKPHPTIALSWKRREAKYLFDILLASYDLALLYLEQCNYDVEKAIDVYMGDEKWEREHPMHESVGGTTGAKQSLWERISRIL